MIKDRIVYMKDKQRRDWQEKRKVAIEDAVSKATVNAKRYLRSLEGKLYISQVATREPCGLHTSCLP
jgi:hypothetical protein